MPPPLEYDMFVRPSISAPVALLALLALPVCLQAQINGVPSSVTSQGFGGHSANAPRASVTSLGPAGYAPRVTFSQPDLGRGEVDHHRHHHHTSNAYAAYPYGYPYVIGVPVPVAADTTDENEADDDSNYQGGPTIFDRHGSGADSYIPPVNNAPAAHPQQFADDAPAQPEPKQDPTLLVFIDGRKLEVGNYAIVGSTLFDLTPGHPRKIALADLDLDATRKQNDERGVVFQLPINPQAN